MGFNVATGRPQRQPAFQKLEVGGTWVEAGGGCAAETGERWAVGPWLEAGPWLSDAPLGLSWGVTLGSGWA